MEDITEVVKPLFKQTGMEQWTEIHGIKNDNGEMYAFARNKYHCPYAAGDWSIWAYLPDSHLAVLNYQRAGLKIETVSEMAEKGYI
jgi:hypothetical protein